jgi:hypothetical protein
MPGVSINIDKEKKRNTSIKAGLGFDSKEELTVDHNQSLRHQSRSALERSWCGGHSTLLNMPRSPIGKAAWKGKGIPWAFTKFNQISDKISQVSMCSQKDYLFQGW